MERPSWETSRKTASSAIVCSPRGIVNAPPERTTPAQYDASSMNNERFRFWLWAGAALVAGLLLRLWFVAHMAKVDGDSLVYGGIARTWLQHGVYGVSEGGSLSGALMVRPTLSRLPGYPLFLATCFRLFGMANYRAVVYVQVAVNLVSCGLASALAGRLFGRQARLPVLWLAALCPFTSNYAAVVLAETLVFATIALALYAFALAAGGSRLQPLAVRDRRHARLLHSAAAGTGPARRGNYAADAVGGPGDRERRIRPLHSALPVLAAALCVILPLVPWTIRNERVFHVFQPLAPRGANDPGEVILPGFGRWYGTWAIDFASTDEVCWNMDGAPIAFTALPARAFDDGSPAASEDVRRRTAALFADYNATLRLTPAIDARFDALATELIHAHPVRDHFGLPVARVLDMAFRPRTETMPISDEWWQWREHPGQTAFAAAYAALNFAYFVAAFAGFFVWRRRAWLSTDSADQRAYPELAAAMVAIIVLRAALLLFISNSEPRYTLEFFPVFFVWMGALFAAPSPSLNGHAALDILS